MLYVVSCILFLGCIPARLGQVKIIPSLDDFSEIIITSVDYGMITILETLFFFLELFSF